MKFYHPIKGPEGGCGCSMLVFLLVLFVAVYVYGRYFL